MALPRSHYVQEGEEAVYHCFSRCVRRAFLYAVTQTVGTVGGGHQGDEVG
jgi:hypothetical protein